MTKIIGDWTVKEDVRTRKLLQRLPEDCTLMLKRSIFSSGSNLYDEMVNSVPVRTGKLRQAIGLKTSRDGLTVFVGVSRSQFPRQWRIAGWRAHFTEFGTKGTSGSSFGTAGFGGAGRVRRARRSHAATRAQPFIFPALIHQGQDIIDTQRDAVDEALQRASDGA
jgi:HK97 gp10 family phage protein